MSLHSKGCGLLGKLFTLLTVIPHTVLSRNNVALICFYVVKLVRVMVFTLGEYS